MHSRKRTFPRFRTMRKLPVNLSGAIDGCLLDLLPHSQKP